MIGEKIRNLRILKGWTQENMAELIGISLTAYARIERSKTDVSWSRIKSIAKALGVTPEELVGFNKDVVFNGTDKQQHTKNSKEITTNDNDSFEQERAAYLQHIADQRAEIEYLRKMLEAIQKKISKNGSLKILFGIIFEQLYNNNCLYMLFIKEL